MALGSCLGPREIYWPRLGTAWGKPMGREPAGVWSGPLKAPTDVLWHLLTEVLRPRGDRGRTFGGKPPFTHSNILLNMSSELGICSRTKWIQD